MFRQTVLGVLVFALPICARAEPIHIQLIEPVQGTSLSGGSTVVLKWSAEGIDEQSHIEEWEAFLSLDGGRYYGVRITPHLDISIREFRWVVPNVDSVDARILIRLGDERAETAFELPRSIRITAGASPAVPPVRA